MNIATVKMIQNVIDGKTPLKSKALSAAYPVGRVYISADDVSPAALFGGTWEKIEGKFLLGAGGGYSLNSIGGSADAVVVEHDHYVAVDAYQATLGHDHTKRINFYAVEKDSNLPYSFRTVTEESGHAEFGKSSKSGVNGTGKNMPPYVAVNIWKRVA